MIIVIDLDAKIVIICVINENFCKNNHVIVCKFC